MLFDQKTNQDANNGISGSIPSHFESKVVAPRNPTLNRGPKIEPKFTPSTFMKEMSLDTQQKLLNTREMYLPKIIALSDMAETSLQTISKVDIDEPLFQPYPSDITFQKFEPFKTYEVPLLLRNNDKFARAVKVSQVDNPYFTIVAPPNAYQKVAPGVALVFRIQFRPEEQRDYSHEILVATEREKYLVPIKAIGARAILDFPDDITFPLTAVKSSNASKVLFVRNVGNREARFVLQINKPFQVGPENGVLPVGESMQVSIDFHPMQNGESQEELVVSYDTGEQVYVRVYGVAQDINVRLEKKSIHFENTYLEMINQRTVRLSNRSDQLVHFQWRQNATEREDEQQKLRQLHLLSEEEINALQKINNNNNENPGAGPFDFGVLIQRTFINHRRQLNNETYLFSHPNFRLEPIEGDLWPGGSLDIEVLFKPSEARHYEQIAWLDVVGREQRLPLTLIGDGEGAKLESSFQTLDIGCVYVGSTHIYEVVLSNKGFISASYRIRPTSSSFSSCFQFEPSATVITPDNYQAVQITFYSEQLGQFKENFLFEIEGNPNPLIITVSGQVIGPTFYFDQAQLKYGLVSYGFQTTLSCHLFNTSLVPMPFRLHIDQDKHKKSQIVLFNETDEDDEDENQEEITERRRAHAHHQVLSEFQIRPAKGTIAPQSDIKIQVDFTPKALQKYDTFLQVDIDGVGKNLFSLPITAKSTVPRINLHNEILDLGRTFLNHPNERFVRLQNSTSLPVRYQFLYPRTGQLHFHSEQTEGIIEANTTRDVPLVISILQVGDISEKVEIHRVGAREPPLELQVTATGTGPVLFIDPGEIRFGTITVLDEHVQTISLSNESPIAANFQFEFDKKNSVFSCIPQSGTIDARSSMDIQVIAKLNDRLKFNEEVILHVEHSPPRSVTITAQGTGALIVPDIPIWPSLNLGSRFVGTSLVQQIRFTNKGRRHLAVHFIIPGDTNAAYGVRRKSKNKENDINPDQVFRLEPERLEFAPGEDKLLTITGFTSQPKTVDESFICLAIIGRSTGRDKLFTLKIHCDFVEPLMSFSKTDLYFRVEFNDQENLRTPVSSELTFSNISAIDLTANLRVKHPFMLKIDQNEEYRSNSRLDSTEGSSADLPLGFTLSKSLQILTGMSYAEQIYFDPSANTKELAWKCDEQLVFNYEQHAFTDSIGLHGEVHYPNLLIEHNDLDFGCILNGTEVTRYLTMVNVSPLPVKYLWAFILDENERNYSFEVQPNSERSPGHLNQTQIQSGPWTDGTALGLLSATPKLEEIFDISPFFGSLQPGEIEKTSIRFYGHPGIKAAVKAICQVENGPVYELYLHGQASYMAYNLSTHELDFGDVHYGKSTDRLIIITNSGLVPLEFQVLNLNSLNSIENSARIEVEPESGVCAPLTTASVKVHFYPNVPEHFDQTLFLQVAHFQPDEIRLVGTGMFCRLDLNLPRDLTSQIEAKEILEKLPQQETNLQQSLDTLLVRNYIEKRALTADLISSDRGSQTSLTNSSSTTNSFKPSVENAKEELILPDYVVDFEFVILGTVQQKTIEIRNPTTHNITFEFKRSDYRNKGFSFDCDRFKNLPPGEVVPVRITFDPRGANLGLGSIDCRVLVEVTSGPKFHLQLKAEVVIPDLGSSHESLDFGSVKCGECKIATIQLKNEQKIRCEWLAAYPGEDYAPKNQTNRILRRNTNNSANRKKPAQRIFEVLPPSGTLMPGQRVNVQIKFTPFEDMKYDSRVILRINQSSQRMMIICRGVGLEPNVVIGQMRVGQFEAKSSIVFNPILTHSAGDEQEIVIQNPCPFPIEIYNLEFDKQYLEEEKILRLLPGYDENNTILLPTRPAGDRLPIELQRFYEDVVKRAEEEKQTDFSKPAEETPNPPETLEASIPPDTFSSPGQPIPSVDRTISQSAVERAESATEKTENNLKRVAEKIINYDMTPVAQALARHLGIDLSNDGAQARNRRGIAILVHGPPGSGKTTISQELGQHFNCALLSLDQVIIEAIDNPNRSEYAQRAYQMCRDAMEKHVEEQRAAELDADHNLTTQLGAAHQKKAADKKKKGTETADPTVQAPTIDAQPLTAPISIKFKIRRSSKPTTRLDFLDSRRDTEDEHPIDDEHEELMTFVLTEDIFVEILASRLQRADCINGVVFDSLDTSFLANPYQTAVAVLKAINNRSYIYSILTNFSYSKFKDAQARAEEIRRFEEQQREDKEREFIEEMNEDEYDALPEEERNRIDQKRLQRKKDRLLKEQKQKEEARLDQERLAALANETQKKPKKGNAAQPPPAKAGLTAASGSEKGASAATNLAGGAVTGGKTSARPALISARPGQVTDRPTTKVESIPSEEIEKKKTAKSDGKSAKDGLIKEELDLSGNMTKASINSDFEEEKERKKDRDILVKFKTYEYHRNDLINLFDLWDRTKGVPRSAPTPTNPSDDEPQGGTKKNAQKKEKGKKNEGKEKVERTEDSGQGNTPNQGAQLPSSTPTNQEEGGQNRDETKKGTPNGIEEIVNIPTIQIDTPVDYSSNQSLPSELMESIKSRLPSATSVLDGMGQGPQGPPVPKPFEFSVVPFPEPRINPPCAEYNQYFFVGTHENDPNIFTDDSKVKDGKTPEPPTIGDDLEGTTGGKPGRRSRGEREQTTKRKTSGGPGGSSEGKSSTRAGSKAGTRGGGKQSPTYHSDAQDGASESSIEKMYPRLQRFRWVIPAKGEIRTRIRFVSNEVGQFDQTISFEVVGTKRNYKIFCRGVCTFPTISREPRTVFPNRQKTRKPNEIVHKKFILSTEQYDFGPLVIGKDSTKIRLGHYPSNIENLTIENTSPMDVEAIFCFLNEIEPSKAPFSVEPAEMHLKPGESKPLKLIAAPTREGHFDDTLVCCIRENPEPITYKISCDGCTPELFVEPTSFDFGQVLLYRKESRTIRLKNNKLIPVRWRLVGIGQDGIGSEFSTKTDTGIVDPLTTYELQLNYHASRPRSPQSQKNKLQLKLEISDADGMPGAIRSINIPVFVEPYDIILDMVFQKGNERGIDFGSVYVNHEIKQVCTLKNKGKREIKYKFELLGDNKSKVDVTKFFEISPKQGILASGGDRNAQATTVTITFKPTAEVYLRESEIIVVSVINVSNPTIGQVNQSTLHIGASQSTLKGGNEAGPLKTAVTNQQQVNPPTTIEEEVARIRLKITAKATYSKFTLTPEREVNFGPMAIGAARRIEKFIIENQGEHDFKYNIAKLQREISPQKTNLKETKKVSPNNRAESAMSAKTVRKYEGQRDVQTQGRLPLGPFTISPGGGTVPAGGNALISVECSAESDVPKKFEEEIVLNIEDRNPQEYPQGVIYKLKGELVIPQIDASDINAIFEEHRIVRSLNSFQHIADTIMGGVFGEEERRFQFRNVVVGRTMRARFKIANSQKIPVDVNLAIRTSNKAQKISEFFELDTNRAQIPAYGHHYAVVSFTPTAMQSYSAYFEATVDGQVARLTRDTRTSPNLVFELHGEGHLPRVSILRPAVRNKKAQPLMIFNKLLLGRSATQQLVLVNDGVLPAKVDFYLHDVENVFSLQPSSENSNPASLVINDMTKKATAASAIFELGQKLTVDVLFKPRASQNGQRYEGLIRLVVVDNQYEDTIVHLIGESYTDDITLDNIHGVLMNNEVNAIESVPQQTIVDEDAPGLVSLSNTIQFGELHLNESRQVLFSITNHHSKDSVRFEWPEHAQCVFSPRIGHLHAGCTKDIQVVFKSAKPIQLNKEKILCTITKITFDRPINEVPDWDDRMRSIKWIDVAPSANESEQSRSSRPARKKVIEADVEPAHQRIEDQTRQLDIYISATVDFCRYKCSDFEIRFLDTAMLQTRIHEVTITNRGKVSFNYAWQVYMEDNQRPFTPLIDRDPPTPEPIETGRKGAHRAAAAAAAARNVSSNTSGNEATNGQESTPATNSNRTKEKGKEAAKSNAKSKGATRQSVRAATAAEQSADEKDPDTDANASLDGAQGQEATRGESESSIRSPASVMADFGYIPFQIEPDSGSIAVGASQVFKIKFAPLDINDFQARLICCIPNLESNKQGPVVAVRGRSILPFCHFELEESDYLTSGRRRVDLLINTNPNLPPPTYIDRQTRVIEFKSIGIGASLNRLFNVLNPTDSDYNYRWICEDQLDLTKQPSFVCRNHQGKLSSGKGVTMSFDFIPRAFGVAESNYRFEVPAHSLSVPFLLVGHVTEPQILFDRTFISFHPTLLGHHVEEVITLINKENRQFEYRFLENSLMNGNNSTDLTIEPAPFGTVPSNSRYQLRVIFRPSENRSYTYNLQCRIDQSADLLNINVRGEGFANLSTVLCEAIEGTQTSLKTTKGGQNRICFDDVLVGNIATREVDIFNDGKYSFDFQWISDQNQDLGPFKIIETKGTVLNGQKQTCQITFEPRTREHRALIERLVHLNINNGQKYDLLLVGRTTQPNIDLSFQSYNFGPCFIYRAGMPETSCQLILTNQDLKDHTIECLYQSTAHIMVDFKSGLLPSKQSTICKFTFYPREQKSYREVIPFEIDGLTVIQAIIEGDGIDFRVELAEPKNKIVNLGALQVGKSITREICLVNRSRAPISNCLLILNSAETAPHREMLSIQPTSPISLKARGGTTTVTVKFNPRMRLAQFVEQVFLKYGELDIPMFAVRGCCQGYDIGVDSDSLPFGAVGKDCILSRKLVLYNHGDIGASFAWNVNQLKDSPFSVSPANGYLAPGMEIPIEFSFQPRMIRTDLRCDKLECRLEGTKPIHVTLNGSCVEVTPSRETIMIVTPVRTKEVSKGIPLKNQTNTTWTLTPVISGEFFSGPETLVIEPNTTKTYEISYLPLSEGKHQGTVFFSLPDGNGILYNVMGTAEAPRASAKYTRDLPCKIPHNEIIELENWLKKAQRFRVSHEIIKQDRPDVVTNIKYLEYIDIAAKSKRNFKLEFYSYKECIQQIKLTFKNEQTQEYIWYDITFKSTADKRNAPTTGSIELTTPVRQQTSYDIVLDNPLLHKVTFQAQCSHPEIQVPPEQISIPASSQGTLNFAYMPLKSGKAETRIEINSVELGLYTYMVSLNALQPRPERTIYFRAPLGSSQVLSAKFIHYIRAKTDYSCKVDHLDFAVERTITAAPASLTSIMEVNADVTYEPSQLGEVRGTLTISTPACSDYTFPVVGFGELPKPQGPYQVKAGGNIPLPFKNIFSQALTYTFNVDNPLFHVTKTQELIQARKTHRIVVSFDGSDTPNKADVMAKLIVSCPKTTGSTNSTNSSVQWIYYLKGVTST